MTYSPRKVVTVHSIDFLDCGGATSASKSVTIADNPNRCLAFAFPNRGSGTVSSATIGSSTFTRAVISSALDSCFSEIWYCLQPPKGASSFNVSFNGVTQAYASIGFVSLYNVDQLDPINIVDSQSGNASGFTNSFTTDLTDCIAVEAQFNTGTSAGIPAQTLIRSRSGNDSGGSSYKVLTASGASSVGWSGFSSGSEAFSHAVAVFQPTRKRKGGITLFASVMGI